MEYLLQKAKQNLTKLLSNWGNSPSEKSTIIAPTATADPLEDPPGTRSGAHGLVGVP